MSFIESRHLGNNRLKNTLVAHYKVDGNCRLPYRFNDHICREIDDGRNGFIFSNSGMFPYGLVNCPCGVFSKRALRPFWRQQNEILDPQQKANKTHGSLGNLFFP